MRQVFVISYRRELRLSGRLLLRLILGLRFDVEAFLGSDRKLLALQEWIRALFNMKLLRYQVLMFLGVKLPGDEIFQIRIHLRAGVVLLLGRAVEHMFPVTHAILGGLVLSAERGGILKVQRAALIFRIPNRAGIRWITVRR